MICVTMCIRQYHLKLILCSCNRWVRSRDVLYTTVGNAFTQALPDLMCAQAEKKAENYYLFKAKVAGIQPALARLYNDGEAGELRPEGRASGVLFVK